MQDGHQWLPAEHQEIAAGLGYHTHVHAHDLAVAGEDGAATVTGVGAGIVEEPCTNDPANVRQASSGTVNEAWACCTELLK